MTWEKLSPNVYRNMDTGHKMHVSEISGHKLFSAFSPNNYHLGTFEDRGRALLMCEKCNQEAIEWLQSYIERDAELRVYQGAED